MGRGRDTNQRTDDDRDERIIKSPYKRYEEDTDYSHVSAVSTNGTDLRL